MGKLVVSLVKGAANAVKFTKAVPKSSGSLSQALASGVGKTANEVAKKNKVSIFAKWFSEELKHAKNTGTPVRSLEEIHNANVKLNGWLGKIFKKLGLSKDVSGKESVNSIISDILAQKKDIKVFSFPKGKNNSLFSMVKVSPSETDSLEDVAMLIGNKF